MKTKFTKILLVLSLLLFSLLATNPVKAQDCGNGTCFYPENCSNCPEDCSCQGSCYSYCLGRGYSSGSCLEDNMIGCPVGNIEGQFGQCLRNERCCCQPVTPTSTRTPTPRPTTTRVPTPTPTSIPQPTASPTPTPQSSAISPTPWPTISLTPTPSLSSEPYDLNGDGQVNALDIRKLLWHFFSSENGDFNRDGVANSLDFALMAKEIGW